MPRKGFIQAHYIISKLFFSEIEYCLRINKNQINNVGAIQINQKSSNFMWSIKSRIVIPIYTQAKMMVDQRSLAATSQIIARIIAGIRMT